MERNERRTYFAPTVRPSVRRADQHFAIAMKGRVSLAGLSPLPSSSL